MKGSGSWRRAVGTAAALLLLLAAAAWLARGGPRELRLRLEPPEAGIRRVLAGAAPGAPIPIVPGEGVLQLDRLRLVDPLVTAEGQRARVVVVADAEGTLRWRGSAIAVSSLGRETLGMVRCRGEGWCVDGPPLPRLTALLATLLRRAEAFDGADGAAYGALVSEGYQGPDGGRAALLRRLAADLSATPRARLRPLAWQVRIDREVAQVGEDYEVAVGGAPARRLRARFDLREEGGRWVFTGGL